MFTDGEGQWDNPPDGQNYTVHSEGTYAVFRGRIIPIDSTRKSILLISDLDNTLIGNMPALQRFNDFWLRFHYFSDSKLVYSTGRSFTEFLRLFNYELLDPDMVITAVGSEAYSVDREFGYRKHEEYAL